MSVLSWGKPKVEIGVSLLGAVAVTFTVMPVIVEKTALLTSSKGTKVEAKGEGGEVIDTRYEKNSYSFACEVFLKKGDTKPIVDIDGTIAARYSVRLTPEDTTIAGFIMHNTSVSVEETWSSDAGQKLKYTFDGIKPAVGNILVPFTSV